MSGSRVVNRLKVPHLTGLRNPFPWASIAVCSNLLKVSSTREKATSLSCSKLDASSRMRSKMGGLASIENAVSAVGLSALPKICGWRRCSSAWREVQNCFSVCTKSVVQFKSSSADLAGERVPAFANLADLLDQMVWRSSRHFRSPFRRYFLLRQDPYQKSIAC